MFEKEAEEILNNYCDCELLPECISGIRCRCSDFEEKKKLLLEGIEFGYNKAKEEVEDSYRESLCNSELNLASVTEQLEELEKANEWHYTKYELPPEDVPLLCMRGGNVYVAWFILGKWKGDKYNDVKKPYAWREVKLPEPGLQMPMQEG